MESCDDRVIMGYRDRWRQQQRKRIKKFMRLGSHYDRSNVVCEF